MIQNTLFSWHDIYNVEFFTEQIMDLTLFLKIGPFIVSELSYKKYTGLIKMIDGNLGRLGWNSMSIRNVVVVSPKCCIGRVRVPSRNARK